MFKYLKKRYLTKSVMLLTLMNQKKDCKEFLVSYNKVLILQKNDLQVLLNQQQLEHLGHVCYATC